MNPLLLAIVGAIAHADGNTPSLDPDPTKAVPPPIEGETGCELGTRGQGLNVPFAQDPALLAAAQKNCAAAGKKNCDATQVISQAAAICLSKLEGPTGAILTDRSFATTNHTGPKPTGLVWHVTLSGRSSGETVEIDATTGEYILRSRWVDGRPCTIAGYRRRAPLVAQEGWA